MRQDAEGGEGRYPDLTDEQATLLAEEFGRRAVRVREIVELLTRYVDAGGRDRETFDRLLSGLSREGMGIMQYCVVPWFPDMPARAAAALADAAGVSPGRGGMRESVQQQAALGLLSTVWVIGEHHLVRPQDWPDTLPAVVLGAIRRAPRINEDPLLASLGDRPRS